MVTKTEALYNALLPMKIVNFNKIVKKASEIIGANKIADTFTVNMLIA